MNRQGDGNIAHNMKGTITMKDIIHVSIMHVNNRFQECYVVYKGARHTYRYIPKRVNEWIKDKYSRSIQEERDNDFIDIDIYEA